MPRDLYQEYAPVIDKMFQQNGYAHAFAPGTLMRAKQAAKAREDIIKQKQQQAKAAQKELQKAALAAARAKAKQAKSAGDALSTDIANKQFRLQNAGVDTKSKKHENWFLSLLDKLNRPLNAEANMLKGVVTSVKNGESSGLSVINDLLHGDIKKYAQDSKSVGNRLVNDVKAGITGKQKTTFSDVLGAAGVKNPYVKGIGGFGLDVAFDPLNLIPGAALEKPIKGAMNLARKIPIIDHGATAASNVIRSLFDSKYGKDVTLAGTKDNQLLNLERNYINKGRYYKDKSYNDIIKTLKNTEGGLGAGVNVGKAMESALVKPTTDISKVANTNTLVKNALGNIVDKSVYHNPKGIIKDITTKTLTHKTHNPDVAKQIQEIDQALNDLKGTYKAKMNDHIQAHMTPYLQKESQWHALKDLEQQYQNVRDKIGKIDIPAANRSDWAQLVPNAFRSGKNTKRGTDLYAAAEQMGFNNVDQFVTYLNHLDQAHKTLKGSKADFMGLGMKETPPKAFKLPKNLQGAKPRYGYQDNLLNLNFKNDLEKAIYAVTNKGKSASHDAFMNEIKNQTGLSDAAIAEAGKSIRDYIKSLAKKGAVGTIDIPSLTKLSGKVTRKTLKDIEKEIAQRFHQTPDAQAMLSTANHLKSERNTLANAGMKTTYNVGVTGSATTADTILHDVLAKVPTPKTVKKLSKDPNIAKAAQSLIASNDALRQLASSHGIDIADIQGYMAHVLTDVAKSVLDKVGSKGTRSIGGDSRVINRSIHDNVAEINKYMKKKYGIDNFFNPNAFFATTIGQQRVINYIMAEGFKRDVLGNSKFAVKYKQGMNVPKGAVKIDLGHYDFAKDGLGGPSPFQGTYIVTQGAKTALDNFSETLTDKGIRNVLDAFDKVQGAWKKLALFSVGFHARNLLGNTFNMYVRGMKPHEIVGFNTVAAHVLAKARKGLMKDAKDLGPKEKQAMKLYDEFKRQGLKEMSAYDIEFAMKNEKSLMKNLNRDSKGALGKLATDLTTPFQTSKRIGETADEVNRFAMYLWGRKAKGFSPEKAANVVRQSLFDYSNITPAEKAIFKRIFPFWTWMRNNIQYQVTHLVKNPAAYSHLNSMVNESYQATGMDKNKPLVPSWMKESLALPVASQKNGNASMFMPNLPAADLTKLQNPIGTLVDSLTPILKTPIEEVANKNLLTGAPIKSFDGQTKDFMGMKMEPKVAYALSQLGAVRNLSGNMSQMKKGNGINPLGSLIKPFDKAKETKNAKYARIRELNAMEKTYTQNTGNKLPTVAQYANAGVYRDKQLAGMTKYLKKQGYSSDQQRILMVLYKKVINNGKDYADKVRLGLEQQGLPKDVIDKITADYLQY